MNKITILPRQTGKSENCFHEFDTFFRDNCNAYMIVNFDKDKEKSKLFEHNDDIPTPTDGYENILTIEQLSKNHKNLLFDGKLTLFIDNYFSIFEKIKNDTQLVNFFNRCDIYAWSTPLIVYKEQQFNILKFMSTLTKIQRKQFLNVCMGETCLCI